MRKIPDYVMQAGRRAVGPQWAGFYPRKPGIPREAAIVKILLVHNHYQGPRGGEQLVLEQERQLLQRTGHEIVVYRRSNWEANTYSGAKRLVLAGKVIWANDTRREFARLLHDEEPDLVHIHNTFVMISPSIYAACREARVPVVQTLHNYRLLCPAASFFRDGRICEECIEHTLWRSVRYGCYRHSRPATATVALMLALHRRLHTWVRDVTCYVALTEFARSKFLQEGFPPEKIFVKPNFMHPDPGLGTGDGNYVLFAGRLSPEKGVSRLLAAWTRLRNRIPLVIVGGGPQREQLEREALNQGLSSVTFRGELPREQTVAAMQHARFLVFSSECYEGFPMTILESFACGRPVICSCLGAMREIVEDGRTGLHFTPGDADDLAGKVDRAWNNPMLVAALAKEARQEYENKYTAEKNLPILMDIYQRAIAANG